MALMTDKIVIEVGINEGAMRAQNPHVPYTPEEVAADARRCLDAGASVIHFHGRGPNGEGLNNDPKVNIETQRLISTTTTLISYPTYASTAAAMGGWYQIGTPAEDRYAHFIEGVKTDVVFEIGPVDLGAALDVNAFPNPSGGWNLSRGHQINTGEDHKWLTAFCREHRLKMSFAVFSTVHLGNLRNIVDMGWCQEPPLLIKLFFLGNDAGPKGLLHQVDRMNELLGDMDPAWMPVVYGGNQFPLNALAVSLGGGVRVGLGDYPYPEFGAPTNAELVERTVAIARAMGREPATPDEAREICGINAAKAGRQ